jgi:hypothetical protein
MYALVFALSMNISQSFLGIIVGLAVHVITLGLELRFGGLVAHGSIFML